ncbi:MAG: hypothetical protein HC862_20670 [Scytonema sp. RU_4_4]|nr:hypothetical protein [Scytonema sp. RU_4_4]NJR76367.1 hypothetical protein [Scytonema sp. CRU_2_7]
MRKSYKKMLNLERILKQDRLLRAMIGLNRKAFEALLLTFTTIYMNRPSLSTRNHVKKPRKPEEKLA